MHTAQLSGAGTARAIASHDEHRRRWKLRLFTWPFRHRTAARRRLRFVTKRILQPVALPRPALLCAILIRGTGPWPRAVR